VATPSSTLRELLQAYGERVERALDERLPSANTHPAILHDGMRYAVLAGGKRIRPFLVYAAGTALGASAARLDGPACAVELIHTYSLVHDDLPAMDDDDLRRGRATCHKVYGEGVAILVGDALQTQAFHVLAHDPTLVDDPRARLRMIETLSYASGSRGMCGGQAIDLAAAGQQLNLAELEDMHIHKTGALIRASVLLGAYSARAPETVVEDLDHYAKCIGLAFQIQDDILDVTGETQALGKQAGADAAHNKPTFPGLLGLSVARERAAELVEDAVARLRDLDEAADPLRWVARYIVERGH
jgi:geranylgeranyl pyrophosphate synthase